MSLKRKKLGQSGEQQAALFLTRLGYCILKRNLCLPFGEIDILAKAPDSTIVVVEVKTKLSDDITEPHQSVTFAKQKKLIMLAKAMEVNYPNSPIRIDVISIKGEEVEHIENAVWL